MLLLLLLFAILRHEREVISNALLASGNSIHSSSDESEHEADDDDDDEDDRQERNLPYDTLISFDNYFLCHYMPITLFHSLILCRYSVTMQASYHVPERSEDEKFYTDFQIVRQYVSSEANAGESATLICIHSFIHERTLHTKANIMAIQSNFLYCFVYS